MRESEKIKGVRFPATSPGPRFSHWAELQNLGLFRRYLKAELNQPLLNLAAKSGSFVPSLEAGDPVVCVADQSSIAPAALAELPFKPQVESIVKIDVGQDRRYDSPNAKDNLAHSLLPMARMALWGW